MTNIQRAIDDLIDAADILVKRKDMASEYVALIPAQSVMRLERALERAQKVMEQEGEPVRAWRVTFCSNCDRTRRELDEFFVVEGDILCPKCAKSWIEEHMERCGCGGAPKACELEYLSWEHDDVNVLVRCADCNEILAYATYGCVEDVIRFNEEAGAGGGCQGAKRDR